MPLWNGNEAIKELLGTHIKRICWKTAAVTRRAMVAKQMEPLQRNYLET